jgi:hypothetical protein
VPKGETTRYLGFQLGWDGIVNDFETHLNKAIGALQSWRRDFHLSVRARALIIKIFGMSMVWYHMVILPVSKEQCIRLERLQSWFMWDRTQEPFNPNKNYFNSMSLQRMIRPSNMGGLQLYSYPHRVIALKCRHLRRLLVHGSQWIAELIGTHDRGYFTSPSFTEAPPTKAPRRLGQDEAFPGMGNVFAFNTSPNWSKIAASSDPITGLVRSHVGISGLQARKSIDGFPDFKKLDLLSTISEMMELIPAEERFLFYREYATPGANQVDFIPLTSEIFSVLTNNESVILTPSQLEWELAHRISFTRIWRFLHKWTGEQRDKNVTWDFLQSTLARSNSETCPNCPNVKEDREHIFFNCPRNTIIRNLISKQARLWNLPRPPDWSLANLLKTLSRNPANRFRDTALLITATGLAWRIRNRQKHDKHPISTLTSIADSEWTKSMVQVELILARRRHCFTGPGLDVPFLF